MVIRPKRNDLFDYLLDQKRSDLLHSPQTFAPIFLFAINPHLRTSFHLIPLASISHHAHLTQTTYTIRIPSPITLASISLFSPFTHVVCMLRSVLMGFT